VFVPKIPSMRVTDLVEALAPGCEKKIIGIRPGEKLHEVLLSDDEARHAVEEKSRFMIMPEQHSWAMEKPWTPNVKDGFRYASDTNTEWLTAAHMKGML
jgi:UDP-N-acetylglucosamine 4,6-dehydratase/5-epimerase